MRENASGGGRFASLKGLAGGMGVVVGWAYGRHLEENEFSQFEKCLLEAPGEFRGKS
jgi:hypothetical protein